jgi:hypothetical protein
MLFLSSIAWRSGPAKHQAWLRVSLLTVAVTVVVEVMLFVLDPFSSHGSRLVRDVIAVAVFSAAIPGVVVALVGSGGEWGMSHRRRISLGALLGCLIAVLAPIGVLLVHCTSGDCL